MFTTALMLSLGGAPGAVSLPAGTRVALETVDSISSQGRAKGDLLALRLVSDLQVGGHLVARRGAEAVGQVADVQARGGFGTSGLLVVRPLYLRIGGRTVRLAGALERKRGPGAETVLGMIAITPLFSGRSAVIPAGTRIEAMVERPVTLPIVAP
jgi:hypothetical protein